MCGIAGAIGTIDPRVKNGVLAMQNASGMEVPNW